jgi:hypothetical protein
MFWSQFKEKEIQPKVTLYHRHLGNGGIESYGLQDDRTCPNGCNTSANASSLKLFGKKRLLKIAGEDVLVQPWKCIRCGRICYELPYKEYLDIDQDERKEEDLSDWEVIANIPEVG